MTGMIRAALAVLLLALAGPLAARERPVGHRVEVWATSADGIRRLSRQRDLEFVRAGVPGDIPAIEVDPAHPGQTMLGFGAAMTDSSAELIRHGLAPVRRASLMRELFGRQGLALSLLRVPIGASDFSRSAYSLDDRPRQASDLALAHFSLSPALKDQVPALRAARAINPRIWLMAVPWSPPGWMKDSNSLIKGILRPDREAALAAYLVRYADAMERAGVPLRWLSLQNEPRFEPGDYPGMRLDAAARARVIGAYLGPALADRHRRVGILEWDHNWDHPEEPLAVLADRQTARYVEGVAWHCYGGDPAAMAQVLRAHPDKPALLTECSGGGWMPGWGEALGWMADNLLIGAARAGSSGTVLWNLALDPEAGPHNGGCRDCRGLVTIDRERATVTRNVDYYVLGHARRFVPRGSRRIASAGGAGVTHVAFRTPAGRIVLIAHNPGKGAARIAIRVAGASDRGALPVTLPPGELVTLVWR